MVYNHYMTYINYKHKTLNADSHNTFSIKINICPFSFFLQSGPYLATYSRPSGLMKTWFLHRALSMRSFMKIGLNPAELWPNYVSPLENYFQKMTYKKFTAHFSLCWGSCCMISYM